MAEAYKFSTFEEKNAETADDYYPQARSQQCKKSSVGSLQVTLNSLKTQLKSHEIQQTAIKDKLNDLDLYADKLTITNQFLSTEADTHEAKHAQYLSQKSQLLDEIKEWKTAVSCLKNEALRGGEEIKQWKGRVIELQERQQELRQKIKVQTDLNLQVQAYQQSLDDQILQNEGQLTKMRASKDSLSQTLMTLQTFAKSFRRNIQQKEKEITKSKYQSSEMESILSSKTFEKGNFEKEKEKTEWECKMYVHHNKEIERTNDKLKADLQKLLAHLQSLKKTNKNLDNCIKEYSQTGIAAAKKILTISNK